MRDALTRLTPAPPTRYRFTVLTNASSTTSLVVEESTPPNSKATTIKPTGLDYPADIYSLSHVALPFPETDPLYGRTPDPDDDRVRDASYETTSVYGFGHPLYYDNVIKVLRGEAEPETDGREGLKSLEVLIAAYKSARDGKRVALPLEY